MEAAAAFKGGEVRRVHVVYFISRNGKIEQPHLIRVHHLHRNGGVHLRDVKRWLSDLRGKDMPDSFAWSYKRRYKTGFVWQDLMDDDLITPISDNEYVLKGSDLAPLFTSTPSKDDPSSPLDAFSCCDKTPKCETHLVAAEAEEEKQPPLPKSRPETLQIEPDDDGVSPKPPPRLDQESPPPPPSPCSEASTKRTAVCNIDSLRTKEEKRRQQQEQEQEQGHPSLGKGGKKYGSGRRASHVFRNLLTCRAVETNDSAQMSINRRDRDRMVSIGQELSRGGSHRKSTSDQPRQNPNPNNARKSWSSGGGGKSGRKAGEKAVSGVYRPIGEPNCSQCGKSFKPEKLHSHMKSCKALRARGKSINLDNLPLRATEPHSQEFSMESTPSFLLTH